MLWSVIPERVTLFLNEEMWSVCYGPTSETTHLTDLVNFSLSILSYLIVSDFEP